MKDSLAMALPWQLSFVGCPVQVRRQASLAAAQQRRSSQVQRRMEEKALKTVEALKDLSLFLAYLLVYVVINGY